MRWDSHGGVRAIINHKGMKRLVKIFALAVAVTIAMTLALGVPRLRNMASEYATAEAIRDLEKYVQQHDGRWPESSSDLGDKYPAGGSVHVDYTATSERLIENPELPRNAVRPSSGKFYTYPHYDETIRGLHAVLRETNSTAP